MSTTINIEAPDKRFVSQWRRDWFGNASRDLLSGLLIAVALIPESIGFSIAAGVDPIVGLYGSFIIAIITSLLGGRTGMVSASTGSMALVMVLLTRNYGIEYMFAAGILAGIFEIVMGFAHVGSVLKFIPRPVMLGFVNSLAIMIFMTQMDYFTDAQSSMYILVAAGLIIMYGFPFISKKVPAGLVTLVVISFVAIFGGMSFISIGDMGNISGGLPSFHIPMVPFTVETLNIITPYALSLAIVGMSETLLTARIIDEKVGNGSNKNREAIAQGSANIVSSFLGGMAGCAMIGQSMININSGGRGRLSTFTAGVVLLILILVLSPIVSMIPVAALVAIMIVVAISTFDWGSIKRIPKVAKSDTLIMLATMAIVLLTDNLAYGVLLGFVASTIVYTGKSSTRSLEVTAVVENETANFYCTGDLFFASADAFVDELYLDDSLIHAHYKKVIIDSSNMMIHDETAVDSLDKVVTRFVERGLEVHITGMSEQRERFYTKMSRVYGEDLNDCLLTR